MHCLCIAQRSAVLHPWAGDADRLGVSDWFMVTVLLSVVALLPVVPSPAASSCTVCSDHGHVVAPFIEAEIPCQSTTSGIEHLDVDANYPDPAASKPGFNGARLRVSRNSHVHR